MSVTRPTLVLLFAVEALLLAFLTFALLDRRAHLRDPIYGVNQWGYRHDAQGEKEPGERRVAIVGGSSAFESGQSFGLTLAGQLFLELRQGGAATRQVYSVANLSEPQAGADTYTRTLRDYEFLDPDLIAVVDGYDVLGGTPPHGRRRSPVFRATGYLPILPAKMFGFPEWLSDPDGGIAEILQDGRGAAPDISCEAASAAYCASIADTVRAALARGWSAIVVSPPAVSGRHARQQQSLADTLGRAFGNDPRFLYLDLGRAIDLSDRVHSRDGIHRTDVGNHVIAQRIANAILRWPGAFVSKR